jgi:hypothetical protein
MLMVTEFIIVQLVAGRTSQTRKARRAPTSCRSASSPSRLPWRCPRIHLLNTGKQGFPLHRAEFCSIRHQIRWRQVFVSLKPAPCNLCSLHRFQQPQIYIYIYLLWHAPPPPTHPKRNVSIYVMYNCHADT